MKKLIAGMLAAIMAFSLAACGGETDSNVNQGGENQGGEQSAAAEATTLKFNPIPIPSMSGMAGSLTIWRLLQMERSSVRYIPRRAWDRQRT